MIQRILLGLFVLLLIPLVQAEIIVESAPIFSAPEASNIDISSQPIAIEACTTREYTTVITNRNPSEVLITLETPRKWRAISPSWIRPVTETVRVPAGETVEAQFVIDIPCNTEGSRTIATRFAVAGTEPFIVDHTQDITITRTNTIHAMSVTEKTTCPCEPVTYTTTVRNSGVITETYDISVNRHSQYTTIQPARFTLNPGEIQEVQVTALFPCETYGRQRFTATIDATMSGFRARMPFTTQISQCYDYTISGPEAIDACVDGSYSIPYILINDAAFTNSYDLRLRGSGDLSGEYIELTSGQEGRVDVTFTPTKPGEHPLTLRTTSRLGDMHVEKDIIVNARECYDLSLELREKDAHVRRNVLCQEDESFPLFIRNLGTYRENVSLDLLTSSEGVSLSHTSVVLDPEELQELAILFNHEETGQRFSVNVDAVLANNSRVGDTARINFRKISDSQCYDVTFNPRRASFNETIFVGITHVGERAVTYALDYEDATETSTLLQNNVSLAPGEYAELEINAEAFEGRRVAIVAYAGDATFVHWLTITYGTSWLIWVLLLLLLLLILLILLLLLLIRRKPKTRKSKVTAYKKTKKRKRRGFWWVLLLLLLLLLLIGVGAWMLISHSPDVADNETISDNETDVDYIDTDNGVIDDDVDDNMTVAEPEETLSEEMLAVYEFRDSVDTNSFEYQVLYANTSHVINLAKVFYDPDGDPLVFSAEPAENISIVVHNQYVILTPEDGFYGIRTTRFTATDPHNLSAESPEITLIVLPEEPSRTISWWRAIRVWAIQLF